MSSSFVWLLLPVGHWSVSPLVRRVIRVSCHCVSNPTDRYSTRIRFGGLRSPLLNVPADTEHEVTGMFEFGHLILPAVWMLGWQGK